jgi:hypothetical protein
MERDKEILIDSNGLGMQQINTVHVLSDTGNLLLAFVPEQDPEPSFDDPPF